MILVVLGVHDTFARETTEKLKVLRRDHHQTLLFPRPTSGPGAKDTMSYVQTCLDQLVADCMHRLGERGEDACLQDYALVVVTDRGAHRRGENEQLLPELIQRDWIPALPYAVAPVWQTTKEQPGFRDKAAKDIFDAVHAAIPRFARLHRKVRPHIHHPTETDLCLPMRNFMAPIGLDSRLREAARLPDETGTDIISPLVADIRRLAGFRKIPRGERAKHGLGVYSRPDGLEFRTPGGNLHGTLVRAEPPAAGVPRGAAHPGSAHGSACRLAGLLRFGVPVNQGFHFDCQDPEGRRFSTEFVPCHGERCLSVQGATHVNVYPGDGIRSSHLVH